MLLETAYLLIFYRLVNDVCCKSMFQQCIICAFACNATKGIPFSGCPVMCLSVIIYWMFMNAISYKPLFRISPDFQLSCSWRERWIDWILRSNDQWSWSSRRPSIVRNHVIRNAPLQRHFLQCFDTVGWVIWPVLDMTYNVFGGTLNLAQLQLYTDRQFTIEDHQGLCLAA